MGYKDSAEWCAICALGIVRDAIKDLADGERSSENVVEDLPELEQLLIELRSKAPSECVMKIQQPETRSKRAARPPVAA